MYKCEEASRLREEFWTAFGRYMGPVPSVEGKKINWLNYRTTVKDVHFRMNVNQMSACIGIVLEHNDPATRDLYFQKFHQFRNLLQTTLQEEWAWQAQVPVAEGKMVSRIYKEIAGVSVFNREHWPGLISFFKPRIIALDRFWDEAKYGFDELT